MFDYSKLDRPEVLSFIFYPVKETPTDLPIGAFDIDIPVDDDASISCRFYMKDRTAPNIIYFHGNGETVYQHDEIAKMYNNVGINLLMSDYRGYGNSGGIPTVTNMFTDAHKIYNKATAWLEENEYTSDIFLMGRSLGSACAIDLASVAEENVKGMIIESGFADTLPLAKSLGINVEDSDIEEKDCFNNIAKIEGVAKPTFILHGANDELISAYEGEKLQAASAAKVKQFQIIPGANHNTMIQTGGLLYFDAIKQFIDRCTGQSSWRVKRRRTKTNNS